MVFGCGVSIADTGMSWKNLRNGWKVKLLDGKPLPEIPEEGKIYVFKDFLYFGDVEVIREPSDD